MALLVAHGYPVKTFNIYHHPIHGYEAVKIGFSWPAFFFTFIWMLLKRLWLHAAVYMGLYLLLELIGNVAEQAGPGRASGTLLLLSAAAYFALWLVPPIKGNQWREVNLRSRQYVFKGTVEADSPEAALAAISDNRRTSV